jgi:hypothetical protein
MRTEFMEGVGNQHDPMIASGAYCGHSLQKLIDARQGLGDLAG